MLKKSSSEIVCSKKSLCELLIAFTLFLFINFLLLLGMTAPILALSGINLEPSDCEQLAAKISEGSNIPKGLLSSISRVESGRVNESGSKRGWPWTLNLAGDSKFFENKSSTLKYLKKVISQGKTNIDIGCMQINYRWHKDKFASIEEMLEPSINIKYAVEFLTILYNKHKSWEIAVKHYHSATKSLNTKYYRKVARVFNDIISEKSEEVVSFISALPPLKNYDYKDLDWSEHYKSSNSKSSSLYKTIIDNEPQSLTLTIPKTKLVKEISKGPQIKEVDLVNVSISLNTKSSEPQKHLPKYIKENWKLVLAMRSILDNN